MRDRAPSSGAARATAARPTAHPCRRGAEGRARASRSRSTPRRRRERAPRPVGGAGDGSGCGGGIVAAAGGPAAGSVAGRRSGLRRHRRSGLGFRFAAYGARSPQRRVHRRHLLRTGRAGARAAPSTSSSGRRSPVLRLLVELAVGPPLGPRCERNRRADPTRCPGGRRAGGPRLTRARPLLVHGPSGDLLGRVLRVVPARGAPP